MAVLRIALALALTLAGPSLHAAELVIEGSSTMARMLITPIADAWQKTQSKTTVRIIANDSTNGIAALLDRRVDAAMSSRSPSEVESRLAEEGGQRWQPFLVANDQLTVIVHQDNATREFTPKQLEQLFCGDTLQWQDVGGKPAPVLVMMRKPGSGIHAEWRNQAMRWRLFADGTRVYPNDQALLTSLNDTPSGLSVMSSAQPLPARLQRVKILGPGWQRPLLLLIPQPPREELASFLSFIESPAGSDLKKRAGFSIQ